MHRALAQTKMHVPGFPVILLKVPWLKRRCYTGEREF
jgi:hypothetical protein